MNCDVRFRQEGGSRSARGMLRVVWAWDFTICKLYVWLDDKNCKNEEVRVEWRDSGGKIELWCRCDFIKKLKVNIHTPFLLILCLEICGSILFA